MGVYQSTPVTDKFSTDNKCKNFTYGASSMQGWRISQEDAHNCIPDFDEERNISLFAVYDGHGGAEIAQYCSAKLPDFLKKLKSYKNGSLESALEEAFLEFDQELLKDTVKKELKILADLDDEDDEAQKVGMGKSETDVLLAEANMPLEELLGKYEGFTGIPPALRSLKKKKKEVRSPMIRHSKPRFPAASGDDEEGDASNNCSSNGTDNDENNDAGAPLTQLEDKLANGHAENENNLNMEKELSESQSDKMQSSNKETGECDSITSSSEDVQAFSEASSSKDVCDKNNSSVQSSCISSSSVDVCTESAQSATSSGSKSGNITSEEASSSSSVGISSSAGSSSLDQCSSGSSGGSSSGSSSSYQEPACSSSSQVGSSSRQSNAEDDEEDVDDDEEKDGIVGVTIDAIADEDDDSSEDEDVEYGSDEDDDEDDDEEEESEEEEEEKEEDSSSYNNSEEPGSDSGCTAVLVLIQDKEVYVANAGDSRCVLCRKGNAIDLSFDHKPEDEPERKRIEAAGGKVTADGRVNGGLNLSRAIGDHLYKQNNTLSAREQMITALPDIQTTTLEEGDEFLVLACDGIWNYMSSQEVVDFIREKLKDPEKRKRPSLVCEQIFDYCLAPNTMGDGTGCDNMTCIVVTFEQLWNNNILSNTDSTQDTKECEMDKTPTKREASCETDEPPEKRAKLESTSASLMENAVQNDLKSKEEVGT